MQRQEEAREQLAVDVEPHPDRADRDVAPAQDRCVVERRPVEHAVHEARGDEQPRGAVQRPPAVVAAEDAADVTHDRCIARREHEAAQRRGTTDCQRGRIAHSASATRPMAPITPSGPPSVVPSGFEDSKHVRSQQDQAGDRDAAMPDRGPVDPVEPLLHPGQRADEHEPDREEQDRLGAQQLPDIAAGWLSGGPGDDPQDDLGEDEDADRRRPDLAGDESPVHADDPIARARLARGTGTPRTGTSTRSSVWKVAGVARTLADRPGR